MNEQGSRSDVTITAWRPADFFHISNLLTYVSLSFGVLATASALELHDAAVPGACLAMAVLVDTFDGRYARRFKRGAVRCAFGVQIDSLADAVTFGFVPTLVVYVLLAQHAAGGQTIYGIAAFVYIACAITRLGAYNVVQAEESYFIGVPTPVAALAVASLLPEMASLTVASLVLCIGAFAMVSPVRVPRPRGVVHFLFIGWAVGVAFTYSVRAIAR